MTTQFDSMPDGQLLTATQAAEFLGIKPMYVYKLKQRRRLADVAPKGMTPRFLLGDLRKVKDNKELLTFNTLSRVNIADPDVSDDAVVGATDVARYLGVTRVWVYRLLANGKLPKPLPHNSRVNIRWKVGDIRALVRSKEDD